MQRHEQEVGAVGTKWRRNKKSLFVSWWQHVSQLMVMSDVYYFSSKQGTVQWACVLKVRVRSAALFAGPDHCPGGGWGDCPEFLGIWVSLIRYRINTQTNRGRNGEQVTASWIWTNQKPGVEPRHGWKSVFVRTWSKGPCFLGFILISFWPPCFSRSFGPSVQLTDGLAERLIWKNNSVREGEC